MPFKIKKKLRDKINKLENEEIVSLEEVKEENKELIEKEKRFRKAFSKK